MIAVYRATSPLSYWVARDYAEAHRMIESHVSLVRRAYGPAYAELERASWRTNPVVVHVFSCWWPMIVLFVLCFAVACVRW